MNEGAERRVGRNESLFREANEAIARGLWPGEEDAPVRFRCECAAIDCNDAVELLPEEYRQVRSDPRRFVLVPGHELPEVETVVAREPSYVVVEKRAEAAAVAEALDPRS
jgi:hypothetical protein